MPDVAKGKTGSISLSRLSSNGRTIDLYEILQNIWNSKKVRFASADRKSRKEQESEDA
jgi:hypothetical protein